MWGHNYSTTNYGHICNTPTMPCLCTGCHASLYHDYTNNNHLLAYQGPPQNPVNYNPQNPIFHDQEAVVTNEIDSWLLLNPADQNFNQYQGHFNPQACMQQVNHHGNHGGHHHHHHHYHHHHHQQQQQQQQQQHQEMYDFSKQQQQQQQHQEMYDFSKVDLDNSTPASFFNASLPAIVPETTPGSYSNTEDWSRADEFSFLPFHPGNLIEEAVGSNSNSTSLSSGRKQKLDASHKPFKFPPMSRQDRVQRYFEKKKTRKYEKKLTNYSSRRTYAQTRPRIRGRFARRSQVDAQ